jgi:hypothetical protein
MPALSLLYIIGKLAERKINLENESTLAGNEVSVTLEELFDELHTLWKEKGIALCSDFNQVLDQLDLLEAAGYLEKREDDDKRMVLGIKIETLKELDEIIPEYVKKHLPII